MLVDYKVSFVVDKMISTILFLKISWNRILITILFFVNWKQQILIIWVESFFFSSTPAECLFFQHPSRVPFNVKSKVTNFFFCTYIHLKKDQELLVFFMWNMYARICERSGIPGLFAIFDTKVKPFFSQKKFFSR